VARFFRRGVSRTHFLPACANPAAPSRAEINAGTNLTGFVAGIEGFSLNNSPITTPDLSTTFDSQIDGPDATDDSALVFYDDNVSTTVRTALAKGTAGFILLMPYGDVATKRCEVWPVKSTGYNDQWTLDAEAAKARCGFAVTAVPTQNAVVPA